MDKTYDEMLIEEQRKENHDMTDEEVLEMLYRIFGLKAD